MFRTGRKGPWPPSPDEEARTLIRPIISNITEVVTGGILRAGKTAYGSGTGWWLGKDPADNECKFDIGTPSNYFRYDQTNGVQIAADGSGMTNIDGAHIQAGSIVLTKLGSGITDRMFNTGVLSDNIQAWVHANDATLIDGGDIYTNTITATQIAADTVTAAQIAAHTITATEIAANTITAAEIAANAITASEIAAGTITADEILVGTLTYEQLACGLLSDNLVVNSGFEDGSHPHDITNTGDGTWSVQDTIKRGGSYALKYDATGQTANAFCYLNGSPTATNFLHRHVSALEGREYSFTFYGYRPAGDTFDAKLRLYTTFRNASGTIVGDYYNSFNPTDWTDDTWTECTTAKFAPAGTAYVVWLILIYTGGSGALYFDDIISRSTIGATLIQADCITASHIAAGTITATEIAANTITAAEIAANAITAAEIAAATITATEIAVGTITFDRLISGALSNNLVANPGLEDGSDPHDIDTDGGGTWTVQDTIKRSGAYALQYNPSGQDATAHCYLNGDPTAAGYLHRHVLTHEDQQYTFSFHGYRAAATTANTLRAYTRFYDATGSLLNAYYTTFDPADWTDDTWTLCSSSKTAPAGATYVVFDLASLDDSETGSVYLDDIEARTMIGTGLIQAGAVTATEIAANTITAGQIAAATITAAEIAAATITAAEIAANTITAAEIAAGTITATEIAANAVTATKIDVTNLQAVSAQTGALTVDDVLTMGAAGIITWMSGAAKITDDYMDLALTTSDRYAFRFLDSDVVHAYFAAYKSANLTQVSIEAIGPGEDKYGKIALAATEWTGASPETVDMILRSDTGVVFSALNYAAARRFKVDTMDAWFTNKVSIGTDTPQGPLHAQGAAFPVAYFERATTLGTSTYGAIRLVRSTTATALDNIGVAFYFGIENDNGDIKHAGMLGARLTDVSQGSEKMQLVFGAADGGTDPYNQIKMVLQGDGNLGIGDTAPSSLTEWNMPTENLEFIDAGSVDATEQDWIGIKVGGTTGYIRVFAAK